MNYITHSATKYFITSTNVFKYCSKSKAYFKLSNNIWKLIQDTTAGRFISQNGTQVTRENALKTYRIFVENDSKLSKDITHLLKD